MEGPYYKAVIFEQEKDSTNPEDNRYGEVIESLENSDDVKEKKIIAQQITLFKSLTKEQRRIMDRALVEKNMNWTDLKELYKNPTFLNMFAQIIAFWDSPFEGRQKDAIDHLHRCLNFCQIIRNKANEWVGGPDIQ